MAWVFGNADRLVWDLERIICHEKGPEPEALYKQFLFPEITIEALDEHYAVSIVALPWFIC